MLPTLQQLVETLAERLDRSVAIDDEHLHLLAHSSHAGSVDPARTESILRRAVSPETAAHVHACRDRESGFYRVTPRPDLGLLDERIGAPIIRHRALLGFIWLLGSEGPVSESAILEMSNAAADAAAILDRHHSAAEATRLRGQQLIGQLLSADEIVRRSARDALIDESYFPDSRYTVLVVEPDRVNESRLSEHQHRAFAASLAELSRRRLSRKVLTLERRDHAVILVGCEGSDDRECAVEVGEAIRRELEAVSLGCWIGVGRSRDDLTQARGAHDEALRALSLSQRLNRGDEIAALDDFGAFELLDHIPNDALRALVHPGVRALVDQNGPLLRTLEVFLDCAGDVKMTSETLFAHRTSIYYRLRRLHELTGLDLTRGEDRLIAHLGLKAARLLKQLPREP